MITTIEDLREKLGKFNSQSKYMVTCEYCHNQLLYTEDELQESIIKCPYCGHTQKVFYKNKYNMKLKPITSSCFDDDSYKV
jgi:DNA-directed RNA polymerase subunit RPC12/RpoP